jgi:hypothetical protein
MQVSIQLFPLCLLPPDLPSVLTLILIRGWTGLGIRRILLTLILIHDSTLDPHLHPSLAHASLMLLLIIQVSHEGIRLAFSMGEDGEKNVIRYDEFISMVSSLIPLSSSSIPSNAT